MTGLFINLFGKLLRCVLYLAITGELVSCTLYMKQSAYKSVRVGIISLKAINNSFGGLRSK